MRRIYVASSWRNAYQPGVVTALREAGHEVFDFRGSPEDPGFSWARVDADWESWTTEQYVAALAHPVSQKGFRRDADAMAWADTCVLVLPCGRSAHIEAGWFAGAGRDLVIYQPEAIEPELMYGFARTVVGTLPAVLEALTSPAPGPASEIERLRTSNKAAEKAITHVLVRAREDAEGLGYFLGPYTESFEGLCRALAQLLGKDVAEVRAAALGRER